MMEIVELPKLFITHGSTGVRMIESAEFNAAASRNKIVKAWHLGKSALVPGYDGAGMRGSSAHTSFDWSVIATDNES